MERVEVRDEKLCVSVVCTRSSTAGRCRGRDEPRHEHDENQNHPHRRRCDSSPETLPRLGDERKRTSTGSDQRNHRHQRSIGMAGVDHEIRTEHSAESTEVS